MQRADGAGLGVAIIGHGLLFAALSLAVLSPPKPVITTPPVDIQIVDEVGLKDQAPNPSQTEPAPSVAPDLGPPVEATPVPPQPVIAAPPEPRPQPAPPPPVAQPRPKPAPVAKPSPPKAPPAKAAPPRRNLPDIATPPRGSKFGSDFLKGITDRPSAATGQAPRAPAGPAVEASLAREVLRQLKPHWKAPTGADAEQLRTTLSITLNRDGTVAAVRVIDTTGITDSNRGQVRLHQEAAVKAVRLAAPFVLPADLYDAWKVLEPVGFDKRLG